MLFIQVQIYNYTKKWLKIGTLKSSFTVYCNLQLKSCWEMFFEKIFLTCVLEKIFIYWIWEMHNPKLVKHCQLDEEEDNINTKWQKKNEDKNKRTGNEKTENISHFIFYILHFDFFVDDMFFFLRCAPIVSQKDKQLKKKKKNRKFEKSWISCRWSLI